VTGVRIADSIGGDLGPHKLCSTELLLNEGRTEGEIKILQLQALDCFENYFGNFNFRY